MKLLTTFPGPVCSAVPVWMKREQEKSMAKFKFVSPMWVVDSVLAGVRLDASDYFPNPKAPLGVSRPPSSGSYVALPNIMQVKPIASNSSAAVGVDSSYGYGLKKIGDMMPQPLNTLSSPKPMLNRQQSVNLSTVSLDDDDDGAAETPALRLRQAPVNEKLAKPMPAWYNSVVSPYSAKATAVNQSKPAFRSTNSRGEGDMDDGPGRMLTSKENPNFVSDYFASSRLHHLSRYVRFTL
jgi:hypothetical protein